MNPPTLLTRATIHPLSLAADFRFTGLNLGIGDSPSFSGLGAGVSVGGDIPVSRMMNLRVNTSYNQSWLSRAGENLNINGFGLSFGPNLFLLDRWLNVGLYAGLREDVFHSDTGLTLQQGQAAQELQNVPSTTFTLRPELCFAGQSVCGFYEYAQSLGLNLASGAGSNTAFPSAHSAGVLIDAMKLYSISRGVSPYIDTRLSTFWRSLDMSLVTLGSVTVAPLAGEDPLAYRTFESNNSIPRWNNTLLLIKRTPNQYSPFGGAIGINLGQDTVFNVTHGLSTQFADDQINFAVLPAYLSLALAADLSIDAGIIPSTIGYESPMHQDRFARSLTRGFYLQPYWWSGARINYTHNENHSFYAGVSNRTDTFLDHQTGFTGLAGWSGTFGAHVFAVNLLGGAEGTGPRGIVDLILTSTLSDNTSLIVNADVGTRANDAGQNLWYGFVNATLNHKFGEDNRWNVYGRIEGIGENGVTGTSQLLLSGLAGLGLRIFNNDSPQGTLTLNAEASADVSLLRPQGVASPFGASDFNPTLLLSAMWVLPIHRAR